MPLDGGSSGLWVGLSGTDDTFAFTEWDRWWTASDLLMHAGDFNGDGRTDMIKVDIARGGGPGGVWVEISDGARLVTSQWDTWDTHPRIRSLVGDFNGDGLADIVKIDVDPSGASGPGDLRFGLSSPDGGFLNSTWDLWTTYSDMLLQAGDFNGDGATDVMKIDVSGRQQLGLWVGLSRMKGRRR